MSVIKLSRQDAMRVFNRISSLKGDDYTRWMDDCADNTRFVEGGDSQWTADELAALQEKGSYTMTMDMTLKAVNAITGMLTANKPKVTCYPVGDNDQELAEVGSMLIDRAWRNSKGLANIRKCLRSALISNIAYLFVYIDSGEVKFSTLEFNEVLVDPRSKDLTFDDAEFIAVTKCIPIENVKAIYGIQTISTESPFDIGAYGTLSDVFDKGRLFDQSRQLVNVYEFYRKIKVKTDNGVKNRIVKETLIGYEHMYRELLDESIVDFPIIPIYSNPTNNPYKFGEVHYMRDPQRFANKMYNVVLQSAQSMSTPKLIVRTTDVPNGDIEAFGNNWAIPGTIAELNPGAQPPIVVPPQQLNGSYFTLYQDAMQHLYRMSNTDGGQVGDSGQGHDNAESLLMKKEMIMDNLKMLSSIYETALSKLGQSILQHYQAYVPGDKIIKICDAEKLANAVKLDIRKGLDVKNDASIEAYIKKRTEDGTSYEVADIEVAEAKRRTNLIDTVKSFVDGNIDLTMDVEVVEGSYSPTYKATKFNIALTLSKLGAIDPDSLLELSPIDNKEVIRKRLSAINSMNGTIKGLQGQIDKLGSELESKNKEIERLTLGQGVENNKAKLAKVYGDERAKTYINKKSLDIDKANKLKQLDFDIQKLMLTVEKHKEEFKDLEVEDIKDIAIRKILSGETK